MKTTNHTPSPWKYDSTWGLIEYGKTQICALHSGNKANAHLIAAAPDLLEILKSAVARIEIANEEGDKILSAWLPDARAAIAKAEGSK